VVTQCSQYILLWTPDDLASGAVENRRYRRGSPTLLRWASLTWRGWRAPVRARFDPLPRSAHSLAARFFPQVTERVEEPPTATANPDGRRPRERKCSPRGSNGRREKVCPCPSLGVLPVLASVNRFDSPIAKYQRKLSLSTLFLTIGIVNHEIYYVLGRFRLRLLRKRHTAHSAHEASRRARRARAASRPSFHTSRLLQ